MNSFKIELAKISGWHDGEKVNIQLESSGNKLVILHENAHAEIINNTPDGKLLALCMSFLDEIKNTDSSEKCKKLIVEHIDNARHAHECAATYIGIKLLQTKEEMEEHHATLQSEYINYYSEYESWIEDISPSSYIQVIMSKCISSVIFSSCAIQEFCSLDFDYQALSYDYPNKRHEKFGKWWLESGKKNTLQYFKHKLLNNNKLCGYLQGEKSFFGKLDDDSVWEINEKFTNYANNFCIKLLYQYLIKESPLKSISTMSKEFYDVLYMQKEHLKKYGWNITVIGSESEFDSTPTPYNISRSRLNTATESLIHSEKYRTTRNNYTEKVLSKESIFELIEDNKFMLSFCFNFDNFITGPTIIEVFYIKNHNTLSEDGFYFDLKFRYHFKINSKISFQLLTEMLYRFNSNIPHAYLDCCLIPYLVKSNKNEYKELKNLCHTYPYKEIIKYESNYSSKPKKTFHFAYVEYLNVGLHDFIENNKSIKLGVFYSGIDFQQNEKYNNLFVIAIKSTGFIGWKIKILSKHSLLSALPYLHEYEEKGLISIEQDAAPSVESACRLAIGHWDQY